MADCASCGKPILDTAYVCHQDSLTLEDRLRQAAELWAELDITITRQDRMATPGPHARGHAPAAPIRPDGQHRHYGDQDVGWASGLPANLAASDAADSIRNTVTTWARHIESERGVSWEPEPPPRVLGPLCPDALRLWPARWCEHGSCASIRTDPPPVGLDAVLRWLAGQLDWLRYRPEAGEAFEELDYAAALVWRTVDRPAERRWLGVCGEPDGLAGACPGQLHARPGAAHSRCPKCGTQHDVATRKDWLDGLVLDHVYTAAEIEGAYPDVRADRIRQWASRGRITNHGHDRHGRPLYQLAEVLELARTIDSKRREKVTA